MTLSKHGEDGLDPFRTENALAKASNTSSDALEANRKPEVNDEHYFFTKTLNELVDD